MLEATLHIVGSFVALFIFGVVSILISEWESGRNRKTLRDELTIAFGVNVDDLEDEDLASRMFALWSKKYSADLLRNRFSDFCGLIRNGWGWIGNISQIVIFFAVIWYTFSDSYSIAIYSWSIVGIAIFFWITGIIFSFLCKLLTGRYPGEAKLARNAAVNFLKNQPK